MTEDRLSAVHRRRNEDGRDGWDRFAPHRSRVLHLLREAAARDDAKLCVLGAGNCNDLDLAALAEGFAEIELVDLDPEALRGGVQRQQLPDNVCPRMQGGVDLSGILPELVGLSPQSQPNDAALCQCLAAADQTQPPVVGGPFDVVASVCLLTQLIDSVQLAIGAQHPRFVELLMRVRNRHLRLLIELLRPGGTAVLVSDIVSSMTCPELPDIPADQLPQTVARLISERNFFTGANPVALRAFYLTDPQCCAMVEQVQVTHPWLWDLGPRVYAVCALIVRRKS